MGQPMEPDRPTMITFCGDEQVAHDVDMALKGLDLAITRYNRADGTIPHNLLMAHEFDVAIIDYRFLISIECKDLCRRHFKNTCVIYILDDPFTATAPLDKNDSPCVAKGYSCTLYHPIEQSVLHQVVIYLTEKKETLSEDTDLLSIVHSKLFD